MKTKNTALPLSRVAVDTRGTKTVVELWDGTYTESKNQEGSTEYEYDMYLLETRLRPGLAKIIESNFDVWHAAAKAKGDPEPSKPIEERVATVEQEQTKIIDALATAFEVEI